MSQENVEVARHWYEAINGWLETYWADPGRSLGDTPGTEALFGRMDPEVEWNWLFTPGTLRGREQLLGAASDWIETVDSWRIEVEDVLDGSDERVVALVRVVARGRGSGVPVDQRVFSVLTVRDGKVARIDDHTERADALEAAGLSK
jgi:ketosteroid isomerase-like protein